MFINVEQNTEEWFIHRLKKTTSSNFAKFMANFGKAFGEPAKKYAQRIALEYVTGKRDEESNYSNRHMERGHKNEPIAIMEYEQQEMQVVSNGGFYIQESKEIILLGDSNDGNVGKNGCIEVKSVIADTQWERLKKGGIDPKYKWQIQGHLWIGGKNWCDFISYCPEMPKNKQLYVCRVFPDKGMIEKMIIRVAEFRLEIEKNIKILEE